MDSNKKLKAVFPEDWFSRIFLGLLILASIIGAVFASKMARRLIAQTTAFTLPGDPVIAPEKESGTDGEEENEATKPGLSITPAPKADLPEPDPWDGTSRVSMLFMGLDLRDVETMDAAPRSDTMILLSMDPLSNTASVIAIPRDLWVPIPGFGYYKINTAFRFGELYNLPGGGPELATRTVEELLGVPIDYYMQLDFQAFVDFIDIVHGIRVTFSEPYTLDRRGPGNTVTLDPGTYVLDGEYALAYARDRKSEGDDFDRSNRQLEVILLVRDQILKFDQLPTLVLNAPKIYEELSTGVRTNMSLNQMIRLAWRAVEIPGRKIETAVIGPQYVTIEKSPDGLDILRPIPDKIRLLRDETLGDGGVLSPAAEGNPLELAAQENAQVIVLNGSYQPDLGTQTTAWLQDQGFDVIGEGNTQATTVSSVTLQGATPYTLRWLVETFGMTAGRIKHDFLPDEVADIILILGEDWAANNPMQ